MLPFFFPQPLPIATTTAPAVLEAALVPVCACESTGRRDGVPTQWNPEGNVLHGKLNNNDIGMCQINVERRNGNIQQAEKLGLNVYTEQGNIRMANWLYHHQGLTPWNWSKGCWAGSPQEDPS